MDADRLAGLCVAVGAVESAAIGRWLADHGSVFAVVCAVFMFTATALLVGMLMAKVIELAKGVGDDH